jgi:acetylornithine/N-succinyldiaminopimelate aminotransferase
MSSAELIARHQATMVGNYGKLPAVMVRGEGSFMWDAGGTKYIDLFAGFGGTILGHCHPALVEAVTTQAHKLWAVGNQFYTEPQIRLAEHLSAKAFPGRAFFCHSGAEAAEAAIKLARISAGEGKHKIVSFHRGFHGRTLGALSATAGKYQDGFGPMVPGFSYTDFGDLDALESLIDDQTAAILMEPIQGEGGIHVPSIQFMRGVRQLCDHRGVALIFDEVWTGVGRTGKYFGHQHFGVTPDIMAMGKALGGGMPVGAILAKPERAAFFKPGTHGCTLGGNPICAAVAAAVFDTLEKDGLVDRAAEVGEQAMERIRSFSGKAGSRIKEVRGKGLFIGVQLDLPDGTPVQMAALAKGLSINVTQKTVVRISPALTIEEGTLEKGLAIFEEALAAV